MARPRAQHLLGRPQRVAPAWRPHHCQKFEVHARGGERGRVRQMRRGEPGDAPALGSEGGKRGQHELQLPYALARDEDLGERPRRPPAAGQLAVERRKAGRHRGSGRRSERAAAPDGLPAKDVLKGRHGYCIFIQYRGGWQEA